MADAELAVEKARRAALAALLRADDDRAPLQGRSLRVDFATIARSLERIGNARKKQVRFGARSPSPH